jgi:hypothetical protein
VPISYQISTDLDLVYARWEGRVTFDDILWNLETYVSDPAYRPGRPELIDATEIEEVDVDFARARAILRLVNHQNPSVAVSTHTVLLVPGDTVFGLGRMFQQLAELAEGIQVDVFRDEAEALAALALPCDTVETLLRTGAFAEPAPQPPVRPSDP